MAKQKLNIKFILILAGVACVIVLLVCGVLFGQRLLKRPGTDSLVAQGDAAMAVLNYHDASEAYGRAVGRRRDDVALLIKYADALNYDVNGDRDKFNLLRATHLAILQQDPRSLPGLERMLRLQVDLSRGTSDIPTLKTLGETADRILAIDPKHHFARLVSASSLFEVWFHEVKVPQADIDAKLAVVQALTAEDPTDAEAVTLLARVALFKATLAGRDNDKAGALKELDNSLAIVNDAANAAPKTAGVLMARARVLRVAASGDVRPGKTAEYGKAYQEVIAAAAAAAKPGDDVYVEAKLEALRLFAGREPEKAEAAYAAFFAEAPGEFAAREALADRIAEQPTRRDEAVRVMETPLKEGPVTALQSFIRDRLGLETMVKIAQLKLGALEVVQDTADRTKRLEEIDKLYEAVVQRQKELSLSENASSLRLKGGLQLAKGQSVDAVGTFDQAVKLAGAGDLTVQGQQQRVDALYDLAVAHLTLGNTRAARGPLEEVVKRAPNLIQPRLRLADVLIREQDFAQARLHVELLARAFPNNDQIRRLTILSLQDQPDKRKAVYTAMPEADKGTRLEKAAVAGAINDMKEVVRLGKLVLAEDPADLQAVSLTVQALLKMDDKPQAITVAAAAAAAKPDAETLKNLVLSLKAESSDDQVRLREEQLAAEKDPVKREVNLGMLGRQLGKIDEAIGHFKKAQASNDKDIVATDQLFQIYCAQYKWDDAQREADRLVKYNADQTGGQVVRIRYMVAKAATDPNVDARNKQFDTAIDLCRTLTTQYGELATSWLLYGQILQARGRTDQALEQFLVALDKQPANLEALRGAIDTLNALSRFDESKRYIDQALKYAPDNGYFRDVETAWQIAHGDPEKAIAPRLATYQANPDQPGAWINLGITYVSVAQAKTAKSGQPDKENYAKAADLFAAGMAKWPDDIRFAGMYSDTKRALGDSASGEAALVKLAASDTFKSNPEAAKLLARTYVITGQLPKAEAALRQYLERSKTEPSDVLTQLATVLSQQRRYPEALDLLDRKPNDVELQRQRIELMTLLNQLDRARTGVEDRLAKSPTPDLNNLAGFIALRGGNLDAASGYFEKVLAARPGDPAALFYRAQVRLNRNPPETEAAMTDLRTVRDALPSNIESRMALADIHMRRNNVDEATRELEAAWAINPTAKPLLMRLVDAYAAASPPKWREVERVLAEGRKDPLLAQDPDLLITEANMWATRNDGNRAVTIAKQAITMAPENAVMRRQYFSLLLRATRYRELLAESEPVIKANPKQMWLHVLRGTSFRRLDQRDAAMGEYETALTQAGDSGDSAAANDIVQTISREIGLKPALDKIMPRTASDNSSRLLAAQMQQQLNDHKAAIGLADRVLADGARITPQQRDLALRVIAVSALEGMPSDPVRARDSYLELLKAMPDDISTLNNLAYVYTIEGTTYDLPAAANAARRSYDLSRTAGDPDPYIADTYGWTLVLNNKADEGGAILQRAVDQSGKNVFPELLYHLGEAQIRTKDKAAEKTLLDARSLWEQKNSETKKGDIALREKIEKAIEKLRTGGTPPAGG